MNTIITKTCKWCRNGFEVTNDTRGRRRVFCSRQCSQEFNKAEALAKFGKKIGCYIPKGEWHENRTCDECGKPYIAVNPRQRFCTKECQKANEKSGYYIIFRRDEFRCVYCGLSSFEDGVKLHVDHIDPRSKGGTDTASNLVTSCENCNLSKNDAPLPQDTLSRLKILVAQRNERNSILQSKIIKLAPRR